MSIQTTLALILTVVASVTVVAIIILLGWLLIWKAFLSKFRLVRELLGHGNGDEQPAPGVAAQNKIDSHHHTKVKKLRKD